MVSYWKVVNDVIKDADILLEIVDARFVEKTRNIELEKKIKAQGKILIYVVNKCDLIDKKMSEDIKKSLKPSVFISATQRLGTSYLRDEILKRVNKLNLAKIKIGVVGYPNVGKSSVINSLRGRAITGTSALSGFTKGKQLIKVSNKLYLIDTPGVIPYKEKNEIKHAVSSTLSYSQLKNPDLAVLGIIAENKGVVESFYGIKENEDPEEVIIQVAIKFNKIKKKGEPDIEKAARLILKDWQSGKIIAAKKE